MSKLVTIFAVTVGGIWVLYNFHITDAAAVNPVVGITTDVFPYGENISLVVVHIKPHNIGKVPIDVKGGGLSLTLKKYPKDAAIGHIDMDKIKPAYALKQIEKKYGGYLLEPGTEFDEVETFVLPKGETYQIEATLDLGDDTDVGAIHVIRVE